MFFFFFLFPAQMLENEPSSYSFCFPENPFSGVGVSSFYKLKTLQVVPKSQYNVSVDILCPFKLPCMLVCLFHLLLIFLEEVGLLCSEQMPIMTL